MMRQKGLTLSGFVMWLIVLAFAALLGFKLGPPYFEFWTIQKQLQAIAGESEVRSGQRRDVESAFVRRSMIEDIKSVKPADLQIARDGDQVVISAEYTVCVPVIANIRACMDFNPSSRRR